VELVLAKMTAEVAMQRPEVDVLDRGRQDSHGALTSAAFGLAYAGPIGGPVAGARKPRSIDKRFKQPDWLPVLRLPVLWEASADLAQNMTGQMGHPNPAEDEKARVVDDPT